MSRTCTPLLAIALVVLLPAGSAVASQAIVEEFVSDPTLPNGPHVFVLDGPGAAQFVHQPDTAPRFLGDPRGSLAVTYDSLLPTSRLVADLRGQLTEQDDFIFGAVITIRPEGLAADPFGFHPIAFGLLGSATTGNDRTGDLSDFASDTYDTVELAYFPNVSPFFGGPFLSPTVFGEPLGPDAFMNFAFGSGSIALEPGRTYLIEMEHSALERTLAARVSEVRPDGRALPVADGEIAAGLSGITGFLVDNLGLFAYHDGFNEFAASGRSLLATVDFDLLFAGALRDGKLPGELMQALKRFKRSSRLPVPREPLE